VPLALREHKRAKKSFRERAALASAGGLWQHGANHPQTLWITLWALSGGVRQVVFR
jgi:hypothetical protein